MRFLSICSGIEAASVAFHPLGWQALAFAEIEPFPCSLLAHHYPGVPNLGDLTRWREWSPELLAQADTLCGGTPCQAFSVAGLRNSLSDERGNLTLTFCHLYDEIDRQRHLCGRPPAVCLWENVPGVLNTDDNAFGYFLAGLAGEDEPLTPPGSRWTDAGYVRGPRRAIAWRVLDAQYFGLAQRRERVFVVASADPAFDPAAVLFESEGLRRDTPPRRGAGEGAAAGTLRSSDGGSDLDHARAGHVLGERMTNAECRMPNEGVPQAVAFNIHSANSCAMRSAGESQAALETELARAVDTQGFSANQGGTVALSEVAQPLRSNPHNNSDPAMEATMHVLSQPRTENREPGTAWRVRRLTPEECEMLQGFPIGYTLIPGTSSKKRKGEDLSDTIDYLISLGVSPAEAEVLAHSPDGPRYKALGNSWAVPVARWIARRIDACAKALSRQ